MAALVAGIAFVVAEPLAPAPSPRFSIATSWAKPVAHGSHDPRPFGTTYRYANGLEITVTGPDRFNPSQGAAIGRETAHGDEPGRLPSAWVELTVTINNGTSGAYELSQFMAEVGSAGQVGKPVSDSAIGITRPPDAPVPTGGRVTFTLAYWVQNVEEISMEVRPSWDYDHAIYSNTPDEVCELCAWWER